MGPTTSLEFSLVQISFWCTKEGKQGDCGLKKWWMCWCFSCFSSFSLEDNTLLLALPVADSQWVPCIEIRDYMKTTIWWAYLCNVSFCFTQIFQRNRKGEISSGEASAVECTRTTETVESQVRSLNLLIRVHTLTPLRGNHVNLHEVRVLRGWQYRAFVCSYPTANGSHLP